MGLQDLTPSRWLERWIGHLPSLKESLVEGQVDEILELDELWSFVGSKAQQRWLWLALCRRTRQVVAYYRHVFDCKRHRQVNKDEGETNHVERWFNTLRQRLGRFTRKTLSFSKCDEMHEGVLRRVSSGVQPFVHQLICHYYHLFKQTCGLYCLILLESQIIFSLW